MTEISSSVNGQAFAISELLLELSRRVEAAANASALKPAQWSALRYLARAPASARTNRAFARYHHTTTGTVTLTLKSLTDRGLLERQPDPKDGRVVRFDVTEAGHLTLQDDPVLRLVNAVEGLSEVQRLQLTDILTALLIEDASR
ncbi:MAG: MarR family transcriptional regulator [Pseudomonadota bacterium]